MDNTETITTHEGVFYELYRRNLARWSPTIVVRPHVDFDVQAEWQALTEQVFAHLDTVSEPLFLILDLTSQTTNIDEMVEPPQVEPTDEASIWQHPQVQEVIFVAPDKPTEEAASTEGAAMSGYRVQFVETMGEAIAHIDRVWSS